MEFIYLFTVSENAVLPVTTKKCVDGYFKFYGDKKFILHCNKCWVINLIQFPALFDWSHNKTSDGLSHIISCPWRNCRAYQFTALTRSHHLLERFQHYNFLVQVHCWKPSATTSYNMIVCYISDLYILCNLY